MIHDIIQLQHVLEKYKVTTPVSPLVQEHILKNKRKHLVVILKRLGRYNPLFGLILLIYFLSRKLGIGLSIIQSFVAVTVFSLVLAGGISVPVVMYFKTVLQTEKSKNSEIEIKNSNGITDVKSRAGSQRKELTSERQSVYKNTILLHPFESSSEELSSAVTSGVKRELARIRGNRNVVTPLNDSNISSVLMFGSVERIKISYVVSIRIVDKETGKLIFMTTEQFANRKDLPGVSKKLARSISERIE